MGREEATLDPSRLLRVEVGRIEGDAKAPWGFEYDIELTEPWIIKGDINEANEASIGNQAFRGNGDGAGREPALPLEPFALRFEIAIGNRDANPFLEDPHPFGVQRGSHIISQSADSKQPVEKGLCHAIKAPIWGS